MKRTVDYAVKYHIEHFDPAKLKPDNIDRLQIEMIPPRSRVLEIGCATGYMSEYLYKNLGCHVTGIEYDHTHAELARPKCDELLVGPIDSVAVQNNIKKLVNQNDLYDVIFMSQVIEHIAEPEKVILKFHEWLKKNGVLVISTCNIAHWKSRIRLMRGVWEYEQYGIFDQGHLRFFTLKTFADLLDSCGFQILDEAYSFEDICPFKILFDKRLIAPSDLLRLIPFVGKSLRRKYIYIFRNLIVTQFVFKAIPK